MLSFIRATALLFILSGFSGALYAQVSITANQLEYTQNFDGLPNSSTNWNNNTTIPNWYAARTDYPNAASFPMNASTGSSGAANLYSFRKSSPNTNRALGSVGANGIHFAWGVRFKNNSGQTLQSVTVTYYLEQWRRTSSANEQPLRFSWLKSANPITSIAAHESGYVKVPFLNAISPVTTAGSSSSLDGDLPENRVLVSHHFRLMLAPGEEIMLKWYDEDDSKIDHGLAIDDLQVQFSTAAPALDVSAGAVTFRQFMKGVILDIPDDDSGLEYIPPTPVQCTAWDNALQQLLAGQYVQADSLFGAHNLGYRLSAWANSGDTLYVLATDGQSGNYWGTYVFNPAAARSCLVLQAPHPLHDGMTGEQASYLYQELDAALLMVAGAHRCLNLVPSGCAGSSTVCRQDGQYTISDMAHTLESVFQVTTEVFADQYPEGRFVQLHGFDKGNNDPYFVISNGTRQTPNEDFVSEVGDFLTTVPVNSITPPPAGPLSYEAPHINTSYNKLIGTTNTQGRYLNVYDKGDICTGTAVSTSVTGRFLHLEQYDHMRKNPANYPIMRDALLASGITNCEVPAGRPLASSGPAAAFEQHHLSVRYPATETGALLVLLESPAQAAGLTLRDLLGRVVMDVTVPVNGRMEVRLETGALPKGAYMLQARFGAEQRAVQVAVW